MRRIGASEDLTQAEACCKTWWSGRLGQQSSMAVVLLDGVVGSSLV